MCSIFLNLLHVGVLHVNQRMEIGDFKWHKLERNLVLAIILCVVGAASNSDERALRHGSCGNSKCKLHRHKCHSALDICCLTMHPTHS